LKKPIKSAVTNKKHRARVSGRSKKGRVVDLILLIARGASKKASNPTGQATAINARPRNPGINNVM
jgi:hypothetical protein